MQVKLLRMFSVMILAVVTAVSLTGIASAQTHPCGDGALPYEGSWTAPGGGLLEGRISEAWCYSPFSPGQQGNTLNAESWDGAALGTQWKISGMSIDAAGAVEVGRDVNASGFGWIDYVTNYEGGNFWLEGSNSWSDGTDLEGYVTVCNVNARVTLVGGMAVAVTSNITIVGVFDLCELCSIEIAANSTRLWKTGDAGAMPTGYPPFLCGANSGELHYSCCMNASIMCYVTGTEESTWGAIKDMYR
jgi:hypothetical protein